MVKQENLLFPLTLSNSSLSSAWSCKKKWYYSHILHINRRAAPNGHLLAGGLFAKAMENIRLDVYLEGMDLYQAIEKGKTFLLEAPDTGHAIKSNERLAIVFEKYIELFPLEGHFKPCKLANGELAVEYKFSIDTSIPHPDYPERNIMYTGILDGFYERVEKGKILDRYVLDEKTTGTVSRLANSKQAGSPNGLIDMQKEENLFRLSGQMIAYSYAARLQGLESVNALIRRVPILKQHEDAYELEIHINKYMQEAWATSTFGLIEELVENYKKLKDGGRPEHFFRPSYGSACTSWSTLCSFSEGCLGENREAMMFSESEQLVNFSIGKGERKQLSLVEYKQAIERGEIK